MPTNIGTQVITRDGGLVPVFHAVPDGGLEVSNLNSSPFVMLKNSNAASRTITVVTTAEFDALALADRTYTLPGNSELFLGPWPNQYYGSTVTLLFSAVAGVTAATLRVDNPVRL